MNNELQPESIQEIVPLLYVPEMEPSLTFYTESLGFRRTSDWSPDGEMKWCRLERGNAAIMLQLKEGDVVVDPAANQQTQNVIFFFNCANVENFREELIATGFDVPEIETAFYGMKQLELVDPAGYHLCFQSPVEQV